MGHPIPLLIWRGGTQNCVLDPLNGLFSVDNFSSGCCSLLESTFHLFGLWSAHDELEMENSGENGANN